MVMILIMLLVVLIGILLIYPNPDIEMRICFGFNVHLLAKNRIQELSPDFKAR